MNHEAKISTMLFTSSFIISLSPKFYRCSINGCKKIYENNIKKIILTASESNTINLLLFSISICHTRPQVKHESEHSFNIDSITQCYNFLKKFCSDLKNSDLLLIAQTDFETSIVAFFSGPKFLPPSWIFTRYLQENIHYPIWRQTFQTTKKK